MKYIRERLGVKLFLANLIVILVGISILAITIQVTIPAAFNRHMAGMNQSIMYGAWAWGRDKDNDWGSARPCLKIFAPVCSIRWVMQ